MKNTSIALALGLASFSAAHAQQQDMVNGVPIYPQAAPVKPVAPVVPVAPQAPSAAEAIAAPVAPAAPAAQATIVAAPVAPKPVSPVLSDTPAQPVRAAYVAPRLVEKKLYRMIGMGFTGGGEEIIKTGFTDGSTETVTSGGLVAFTAGVEYRFNPQFSLQGNVGFHVDNSTAENGDVHFRRYPLEIIGYYHFSPKWRVGAGLRHVTNVRLKSSGVIDSAYNAAFDDATGGLVEIEYMFSPQAGMKVRVARESYMLRGADYKLDGNHVGIFGNFYF